MAAAEQCCKQCRESANIGPVQEVAPMLGGAGVVMQPTVVSIHVP
jgi:hypothetical protein